MIKAGVVGATGYAGQQLIWLLHNHQMSKILFASSHNYADKSFSDLYGQYYGHLEKVCINIQEAKENLSAIDVLFIALPHGKSFEIAEMALELGVKVIDLGADFRLKSAETYKEWYKLEHGCSNLLTKSVYGLPELYGDKIKKADLIANPGCYPTASILALTPLLKHHLIDPLSIIIDAKSGVSGAGRKANLATQFTECNESIKAYGVASHRHTPEIEQELSNVYGDDVVLSFTPHLVPMNRGILAVCYGNLSEMVSEETIMEIYKDFYKNKPFVRVMESPPETRWVKGSNLCDITVKVDKRTNRVICISAIDNLMKGAAGQAVQNMNLMFGFEETEGLEIISLFP